jgi:dehydrogenase/reductase SDR family protein 12
MAIAGATVERSAQSLRAGGSSVDARQLLDDAIEISIVGSFSRLGIEWRRRIFGWTTPPSEALAGKTVLVTGPTSGLGRAAAEALAGLGARVILVGRSPERLAAVRDSLAATHGEDRFPIVVADMGSLESVRAAVARILATEARLDVLVDNAGTIYPERIEGPDGIEATLAILVVAPFVLTTGLMPLLRRTPGSRVIAVTSGGMYGQRVNLADMQWRTEPFNGTRAYARAKRIQTALIREWARRTAVARGGRGRAGTADAAPTFNAMHPGWADTPGLAETLPSFYRLMRRYLRSPAQGADTIVWLASDPAAAASNGKLFLDRRPRPFDRIPSTRLGLADRIRIWDEVVALTGAADPAPTP